MNAVREICIWSILILIVVSLAFAKTEGPSRNKVNHIIIHTTGGPICKNGKVLFTPPGSLNSMKNFFEQHPILGIHYLIGRDGTTLKSIPENQIANHTKGYNQTSIGIELINRGDGKDPFSDAQIKSLIKLLKEIRSRHKIPLENIRGHSDVDSRTFECGGAKIKKKQDPSSNFPWNRIKEEL